MASIRLRIVLTLALLPGAIAACSRAENAESAADSAPAQRITTVAPWEAGANGATLFDHVTRIARDRAAGPWVAPSKRLVGAAAELDYAEYRDIRFRPDRTIWKDEAPFEVQLFHPGGASDVPVGIHLVEEGRSRRVSFDAGLFSYGELAGDAGAGLAEGAGFAGFRVLHEMNAPDKMDEVVAFLGASYFRLVGPGHVYGLSSRGLAVDIAEPTGEEFPDFVEFWIVRPEAGEETLTLHALLDGPSVAGAYRLVLDPGEAVGARAGTALDVEARLFLRRDVRKLGIAPLTSMYLHGSVMPAANDDFRPRVHDSEGLLMLTADGEWIWRPLTNGTGVRLTSLRDVDPVGFGLVQRTRSFEEYMDLEALYHRRPSVWVDVDGSWGSGGVELLEIPTESEFNDNVVAYWAPDEPAHAGDERSYRYRLATFDDRLGGGRDHGTSTATLGVADRSASVPSQTLAQVARTRIGWDGLPGEADPPPRSHRRVVVDFEGGGLSGIPEDAELTPSLSTSSGTISDLRVRPLPGGGRRATFALVPDGERGADMRLFLSRGDTAVTETWSYLWEPALVR